MMKIFNRLKSKTGWHKLQRNLPKLIILYPLILTLLYLLFIAQDRYVSAAQISVKRSQDSAASGLNIGLLMGAANPSSYEDALYLKEYILSADMLTRIDDALNLRQAYADSGLDILQRLPLAQTREALLRYYQERVHVSFDEKTGLLHIGTEGFNPEFALKLNQAILKESEGFINELGHKIVREQMRFAETQVQDAYAKLNGSKEALLQYQNQHGLLDPFSQAESASKLIEQMQAQKVQLETELRTQLSYLRDDTPQVVSTRNALNALKKQIEQERAKVAAPQGVQLNRLAAQFQVLKAQVDFDTALYQNALTAAEKTRIDAARKLKVLSIVISPQLAEEAEYPHRLYILLSMLLGCSLLYGTLRLILAIIDDHRD